MKLIRADFNSRNEDGSIALHTAGAIESIQELAELATPLARGEKVILSDGEVAIRAVVDRDYAPALGADVWVGRPITGNLTVAEVVQLCLAYKGSPIRPSVSYRVDRVGRFWALRAEGLAAEDAVRGAGFRVDARRHLLVNSAVLAAGAYGIYRYQQVMKADLQDFVRRPHESRIGYRETAEVIERWTGVRPALSREVSVLGPGDHAMVVRLRYRQAKGKKVEVSDAAWEIARIARVE